MSEQSPPSSPGAGRRRSSITELFIPRPAAATHTSAYSPPNTTPMGNTQSNRRGMSITTLGLGGNSPTNQNSPLNAFAKQRRTSGASSTSSSLEFKNSFEDSAVIEEDHQTGVPTNTPASPSFARRVSFGAQALRDVRSTGAVPAGRPPSLITTLHEQPENEPPHNDLSSNNSKATTRGGSRGLFLSRSLRRYSASCFSSPAGDVQLFCTCHTDHLIGEGFNWSEALRDRTRRQPSVSAGGNPFQPRQRATSISTMEPLKEMPKAHSPPVTARLGKPDPLGERMLRGDFMMD